MLVVDALKHTCVQFAKTADFSLFSSLVGRYYLVDVGYKEMEGYMTTYKNTRYRINDFRGVDLQQLQREEKFNYVHAKLRNVIERRFGVL